MLPVDVGDLDDHVVLLAVALEAGDLPAAEHGLEGAPDGVDLEADVGHLLAVEVDLELGLVQLEIGVEVDHARELARLGEQRVGHLLQLGIGLRGLDHELHRLLDRALAERGRVDRERQNTRDAEHARAEPGDDLLLRARALLPVLEAAEGDHLADRRVAGDHEILLDLRNLLRDGLHLVGVLVGEVEGRALGRDADADDDAAILGRRRARTSAS